MNVTFYSTQKDAFNVNSIQFTSFYKTVSRSLGRSLPLLSYRILTWDLSLCIKFLRSKDPTLRKTIKHKSWRYMFKIKLWQALTVHNLPPTPLICIIQTSEKQLCSFPTFLNWHGQTSAIKQRTHQRKRKPFDLHCNKLLCR